MCKVKFVTGGNAEGGSVGMGWSPKGDVRRSAHHFPIVSLDKNQKQTLTSRDFGSKLRMIRNDCVDRMCSIVPLGLLSNKLSADNVTLTTVLGIHFDNFILLKFISNSRVHNVLYFKVLCKTNTN